MFERFIPVLQSDVRKSVGAALARLEGQTAIVALDILYNVLRDGFAACDSAASAKRLIEFVTPVALEWSDKALADLAAGEDNPVRRDLCSKRLTLLAEQLANTCYVEAMRARANLQRGGGKQAALAEWVAGYYRWLGLSYTARALLDVSTSLPWEGSCGLYLALVRFGVLTRSPTRAGKDPLLPLAYLLLANDAFPAVGEAGVAVAARVCQHAAAMMLVAPDFHPTTPLVMSEDSNQAQRMVGWGGPSAADPALCFGVDDVAAWVGRVADDVASGQAPAWLRESVDTEGVLRRLVTAWTAAPGRARNPALTKNPETRAAFDFLRIRGLLGQKQGRLLGEDKLIWPITMEDADEHGVAFLLSEKARPLLKSGLVAVFVSRSAWWLAELHRVESYGEQLFVAARWIGHETDSARVLGPSGDAWRGLYVQPGVANAYQACVLLDSDKLALGHLYRIEVAGANLALTLSDVRAIGVGTWRYSCQSA